MASPRGRKRRLGVDFGQADAAGRKSVRERAALAREKSGAMRAREAAAAARLLHLPPKTPPNPHCVGREWERERERKERGGGRRAAAHLRSSAGAGAGDFLVRVRPVREPPRARLRLTARARLCLVRDSVPVRDDSSSVRRDPRPTPALSPAPSTATPSPTATLLCDRSTGRYVLPSFLCCSAALLFLPLLPPLFLPLIPMLWSALLFFPLLPLLWSFLYSTVLCFLCSARFSYLSVTV
jgi:hypothetical protein